MMVFASGLRQFEFYRVFSDSIENDLILRNGPFDEFKKCSLRSNSVTRHVNMTKNDEKLNRNLKKANNIICWIFCASGL